jgi:hypothetical protein
MSITSLNFEETISAIELSNPFLIEHGINFQLHGLRIPVFPVRNPNVAIINFKRFINEIVLVCIGSMATSLTRPMLTDAKKRFNFENVQF